jgi:hypothetical protein
MRLQGTYTPYGSTNERLVENWSPYEAQCAASADWGRHSAAAVAAALRKNSDLGASGVICLKPKLLLRNDGYDKM